MSADSGGLALRWACRRTPFFCCFWFRVISNDSVLKIVYRNSNPANAHSTKIWEAWNAHPQMHRPFEIRATTTHASAIDPPAHIRAHCTVNTIQNCCFLSAKYSHTAQRCIRRMEREKKSWSDNKRCLLNARVAVKMCSFTSRADWHS